MTNRKLRVCLICSVGGHFKQLLKLRPAWEGADSFFVLFHKPIIDAFVAKEDVELVVSPERNPIMFAINIVQSLYVFLKRRPDVVVSTGAGVAVAMCYIAKLFGKQVVYVEDWCIIENPSVTGKLVYPISDLFIIQRPHLRKYYPQAVDGGELF